MNPIEPSSRGLRPTTEPTPSASTPASNARATQQPSIRPPAKSDITSLWLKWREKLHLRAKPKI